jgi:regulatory protein
MRYCSRRECCSGQIILRLQKTALTEAEQTNLLNALREGCFVNDLRFAEIYCRDKSLNARWGWVKIRRNLMRWGLDQEALARAREIWIELCPDKGGLASLAEGKWRILPISLSIDKRCARLSRFLLSRGFAMQDVIEVVRPYFGKA